MYKSRQKQEKMMFKLINGMLLTCVLSAPVNAIPPLPSFLPLSIGHCGFHREARNTDRTFSCVMFQLAEPEYQGFETQWNIRGDITGIKILQNRRGEYFLLADGVDGVFQVTYANYCWTVLNHDFQFCFWDN